MFFILAVTAIFVVISVYFFFRAEKLQRFLLLQKRDNAITLKESKLLVDSTTLIASRYEEFAKNRLNILKESAQIKQNDQLIHHCELISPLINNYGFIFRECLKGKGRFKVACQKCFEKQDAKAYKDFVSLLMKSEKHIKRFWSSNNLNGFVSLVEALLLPDSNNNEQAAPVQNIKNKQALLKKAANN